MLKTLNKPRNAAQLPLKWEFTVVTPEIAAEWLKANTANRKISAKSKSQYARDMASGNWRVTGDPIRFDINGKLIDGQHRLKACVDSGVNFTTAVLYGLQPSDQIVIDTVRPRSAHDVLAMYGYKGTSLTAAMCRLFASIKEGVSLSNVKLSTTETLRMAQDRPIFSRA